ncbi:MAG: Spy/CpxP family protein refolding chaperone [Candidatus Accumulibacter sp.]|uniref:Spy/CpxP family protein refolding chaperone n=1 Tax=Accumulibacter sp. TaxID=2053492 RepID=UPI0019E39B5D|nr:Spy/CpxP family protein refolding chaperone [Accumulibacter sp.]MBE2258132.1 Spy/CpxP family protein refolding chaperone [Paracoccaceae bacterium]MCB1941479.1 Spy/CpxP family protein refolding chaperone [Accumulibacter sp.]MCP5247151.1 Spy/CpxP family protein refolding chaperone [Accumulibacter sp.]
MNTLSRHIATFLAASSIALAVPGTAQADPMIGDMPGCRGGQGMAGPRDGLPPMIRKLKLTPEQEAQIVALHKQDAELIGEKLKLMRDSRRQLRELSNADVYDEGKVKALTEQGAQAMAEMGQLRARQHYQTMQVLTPAQRKEFAALREGMMSRWQGKRQGRPAS